MTKKRILIVDDEEDMVFALKMQLESRDFEVLTAGDGQEAIAVVGKERPDLIVLDVMLPKIDGFKVCRMLKFDEKFKNIPIIIFTARGQKDDQETGLEVGADGYVTKPFEPNVLLGKVEELLNR